MTPVTNANGMPYRDQCKCPCHRMPGMMHIVACCTERPPEQAGAVPAGWHPRIGERVEVADHVNDAEMWRQLSLWVSAVRIHDTGDGYDVTVAEQWPIPRPGSRGHLGQTDGFRVGAISVYDDLRALSAAPTPPDAGPGEIPAGMVERDMSWIDVAVSRTEGDELIVGYSDGFKGYIDEIHLCDCVDEYHAPPEPGLYRWSGFKVGSWDEGDAIRLTGGSWTPYHLFTSKASAETGKMS